MNFPAELKYSKSHEWVRMDGEIAVVGISDFAQDALGDVVFINLPAEGDAVTAGESFGDVESVKAVSDIISPEIHKPALPGQNLCCPFPHGFASTARHPARRNIRIGIRLRSDTEH